MLLWPGVMSGKKKLSLGQIISFACFIAGIGSFLHYQHGVAEAVEAVVELHGFIIGFEDEIPAGEGGNEHE